MIISRFNRYFDKHGRTMYVILGLFISLSFVVFVTPNGCGRGNSSRDSRFGKVGTMYGKKIKQKDFIQKMNETDVASFLLSGRFISQQNKNALVGETLRRLRSLHAVEERGLDDVSQEELDKTVKGHWLFGGAENFKEENYKNFLSNMERQYGITGSDFDRIVKENIALARLAREITSAVLVTPQEARDEFNRQNEEFVLRYAKFTGARDPKAGEPSDAEIETYFAAHKSELKLPDGVVAKVAVFTVKSEIPSIKLKADRIASYYNRLKKTKFKEKSLEQVQAEIEKTLTFTDARTKASRAADIMLKALQGKDAKDQLKLFEDYAAKNKVTVKETPALTADSKEIADIGVRPNLIAKITGLTAEAPLPKQIISEGRNDGAAYYVPVFVKTVPGGTPEKLTDAIRKDVVDAILLAEGEAYYTKTIEPNCDVVDGLKSIWDYREPDKDLLKGKTQEEKEKLREDRSNLVRTLSPFYKAEERTAWIARFPYRSYEKKAGITEEDIKEYYNDNLDEYGKKEVKASQILIRVPPAGDDKVKAEKRSQIDGILAKLREGEDFAKLAGKVSEDYATRNKGGDLGFFAKGSKDKAIDAVVFAEDATVGEISNVIETADGLAIVKITDKRDGRSLESVTGEIRSKLTTERIKQMAEDAAIAFSDILDARFSAKLEELQENDEAASGAEVDVKSIFEALAKSEKVAVRKVDNSITRYANIPGIGRENELGKSIFELDADSPFSGVISGKSEAFIALWTGTLTGHLPKFANADDSLKARLRSEMRKQRQTAAARAKAKALHAKLKDMLAKGEEIPKKDGDVEIVTSEPFTREKLDYKIPEMQKIIKKINTETITAGSLFELLETTDGAVVVQLVSRTLPADELYTEEKQKAATQSVQQIKNYLASKAFDKRLEEESNTVLEEVWQQSLDNADQR